MRKKPVRKLLVACIAGALFLPSKAFTLGLGEIEVNSALNQQLNADIKLISAKPEDTENLIVKLASRKEFTRAGIDRPYLLNELHFKAIVVNNVPYIKVSSTSPIREPFLNFLVEVDWPKGHLLREYTVLLDPPAFMTQSNVAPVQSGQADNAGFRPSTNKVTQPSTAVSPATIITSSASFRPVINQAAGVPAVQPATQTGSVTPQAVARYQPTNEYRIQSGDTAWSLAEKMRPDHSISVEQMMMALLRANPDAFIKQNINGLKRGYILRIPDKAGITSTSLVQARAMVKQQTALWREYRRQEYAATQPAPVVDNTPASSVADKTSATSSTTNNNDNGAQLKIVSAGTGASTNGVKDPVNMNARELRGALAVSREELETVRVEKEALQQQLDQLKHQLSKTKGVLSVENSELSDVQALGKTSTETAAAKNVAPATIEKVAPDNTQEKPVFVDETAKTQAGNIAEEQKPAEEKPITKPTPAPVAPANHKPVDSLTRLLDNPALLAAGGGGLLLILALIYLIIKRRKSAAEEADDITADESSTRLEDVATMVEEDQLEDVADTVPEDSEETLDTESTQIMGAAESSDDTRSTEADEAEEAPRDDVIAEADVYLAYGIYQQAEELLKNAIKENPDQDDYRVKLAETYYASKNKDAFIDVATELKQRSQGEDTSAWKKVVAMGQDMCADHALFQGSLVGGLEVDALSSKSPQPMDFDLGMDEVEDAASAEIDISSDEHIELPDLEEVATLEQSEHNTEELSEEPAVEEASDAAADELEFGLGETEAVEKDETGASLNEDEYSLDIDVAELDIDDDLSTEPADIELDVNEDDLTQNMEATMQIDSSELGLDIEADADSDQTITPDAELDNLDVDFDLDDNLENNDDESSADTTVIEEADETVIDLTDEALSDEDLLDKSDMPDLDETTEVTNEEQVEADENIELREVADSASSSAQLAEDEDEFDLSSLDDVDEISTKLDLARAYLDMGDHEGARDILAEVLTDGNEVQIQEANELMSQLDT